MVTLTKALDTIKNIHNYLSMETQGKQHVLTIREAIRQRQVRKTLNFNLFPSLPSLYFALWLMSGSLETLTSVYEGFSVLSLISLVISSLG